MTAAKGLTPFARAAKRGLALVIAAAMRGADRRTDFRAAVCRFEDELFAAFPAGHGRIDYDSAKRMLGEVFAVCGRTPPRLALVAGFDDPLIGGFADVTNHRIAIEKGCLYRFLLLHESAHLLVPEDRCHGPGFTYVLQLLYRSFLGIPEEAMRRCLKRHGLPVDTGAPALAAL